MTKIILSTALLAAAFAVPSVALAQFSLNSVPGLGKTASGGGGDPVGQQDALVRSFVAANKDVLHANAKMAEALGLKDKSVEAQAKADALTDGATKGNLEEANRAVADSGGAVAAAMAQKPALDSQAKATFATGLLSLAMGVHKYTGLGKHVTDMSSSLSSGANLMMLPKLQSATYVVTNFPGSATSVGKALQNAVSFARDNGIAVPASATDALKAI